jgi:hypothetical protein
MVTPPPATEFSLAGKFGIGTDNIRIDENAGSTASLLALDITYWLSDKTALDFLGDYAVAGTSYPAFGFNGQYSNYTNQVLGVGFGLRQNLASPIRHLRLQGLFRATYAQYNYSYPPWWNSQTMTAYQIQSQFSETLQFSAALGFEYFMPFCDALSVQSNLAYVVSQNDGWETETYNPALPSLGYGTYTNTSSKFSYIRTGLVLNGLTLSTLSIHFYF